MDAGSLDGRRGRDDELIDLLLSTEAVDAFLTELISYAAKATQHECSLTVRTASRAPFTLASTDERATQADERQYANRAGPCLEALHTGVAIFVVDMAAESRWPPFPSEAAELGARSSMSYPLLQGEQILGALNLYAFEPQTPDAGLSARATQFADRAAGALAVALRMGDESEENANLRVALSSRSVIDQAIGILMGQQRCNAEDAFYLLRQSSQRRNLKLREVAAQVVAGVQRRSPGAGRGRY